MYTIDLIVRITNYWGGEILHLEWSEEGAGECIQLMTHQPIDNIEHVALEQAK